MHHLNVKFGAFFENKDEKSPSTQPILMKFYYSLGYEDIQETDIKKLLKN